MIQTAWRALLVGLGIAGTLAMAAGVAPPPPKQDRLAVVFPPWWSGAHVAAAGASAGDIVGVGGAPFILILRGDDAGLGARARRAGGLLLLDPATAGMCAPSVQEPRS